MSLGLSWPFFFLLKRLFTITINYSRTERMMPDRATITVGMTTDSAVTPTVIVVAVVLQYFLCMIVMFLIIHFLLLSLSPTLKFKL